VPERALLAEIALERGIRGFPRDEVVGLALRAWAEGLLLDGADPYGIALSQVAAALTWSDAFTESDAVLTATVARGEQQGSASLVATARYLRAWPRWYLGRLDDAEADVRAALATPGWEMYEPSARAVLGHILVDRAQTTEAWAALELSSIDTWRRTVPYGMLLETRSRLHVAAGDLDAAARDLAEAGELLDSMGNRSGFAPWRSRLALVRARQGDVDEAEALVAVEVEQAERIGTPRALGQALLVRGPHPRSRRRPRARRRVVRGRGRAGRAGTGAHRARCGARRRRTARRGARTAARGARPGRRHGAVEVAERAERELRSAGGRPRRTATPHPYGLTTSELRVARLAAEGRTNRQIADDLVVSPHTVRFHLANAYRKLGVDDRDALAERLARPSR
jgi:DNA-binding CsgD family transcriptional regulator/predicted negative regulator of RcsB-dependent stress response